MEIKPIYEFLLWDNCKNNCKFCFQRNKPAIFNLKKKEESLNATIDFIKSDKFVKGSHALMVGGELFDSPDCFELLTDFFDKVVSFMVDGTIDLLYVNTNLIYVNLTCLYHLLDKIQENNLFDRLKFTTSYDLEGRFKDTLSKELMLTNLKTLTTKYKDIKIVTNTILTKNACNEIMQGTFSPKEFTEYYRCDINLLPYIIYIEELSASRETIIKALMKVDKEMPGYLNRYIKNFDLPQDKLLYKYVDNELKFCSCGHSECGHSENFKRYSKEGTCFVCDLKRLFNME